MARVAWVLVLLVGCGGAPSVDGGVDDVGIDAGVDDGGLDAPGMDAPIAPTDGGGDADLCEGIEEGFTICPMDTRSCCGGRWRHYVDGPCLPGIDAGTGRDAGPPCSDPSDPGCPCDTEGEEQCSPFQWLRVCTEGVWTVRDHIACCAMVGGA